jgi:PAS domain-containing protein
MNPDPSQPVSVHTDHTMQARMQVLLDASHEAGIGMDDGGRITDWNRQAELLFGWRRQEVLGQPLAPLLIPAVSGPAHGSPGAASQR